MTPLRSSLAAMSRNLPRGLPEMPSNMQGGGEQSPSDFVQSASRTAQTTPSAREGDKAPVTTSALIELDQARPQGKLARLGGVFTLQTACLSHNLES